MKNTGIYIIAGCAFLIAVMQVGYADSLPARVAINKSNGKDVVVSGRSDEILRMRLPDNPTTVIQTQLESIRWLRFDFPENLREADLAYAQADWNQAAIMYGHVLPPYMDYLDVPANNALPMAMKWGRTLRLAGRYKDALMAYTAIYSLAADPERTEAYLWMAYCFCEGGQVDKAKDIIQNTNLLIEQDNLRPLKQMIAAKISLEEGDPLVAADHMGHSMALITIDSPIYVEALMVNAAAYSALHKTMKNETSVQSKDPAGSNATYADERLLPEQTDDYLVIAQTIYQHVTNMFVDSIWADQASQELAILSTPTKNQPTFEDMNIPANRTRSPHEK